MADLIAQGVEPYQRWRRRLPQGEALELGRATPAWSVPWDHRVSRVHARLTWDGQRLHVEQVPEASNPIYHSGQAAPRFEISAGEHFVIGETTFTLVADQMTIAHESRDPVEEQAFSSKYLQQVRFRNAQQRIDVLSRLPEVIRGASSESELCVRLVNLVLAGIPRCDTAALVSLTTDDENITALHWDRRLLDGGDFHPSQRLITATLKRGQSLLHVWGSSDTALPAVTANANYDWAFCTPVPGEACRGWAIYVAGRFRADFSPTDPASESADLRDDLKFTELVAAILSSLREVHLLQHRQAQLRPFFAPAVLNALAADEEAVRPRETEVTVLFCDLRGFALESERSAEELMGLLNRVSTALGVMTHHILEQGGVFGDFQGDAAMGFWGWPIAQPDAVDRACRAALAIREQFAAAARRPGDPLANFQMGIGIATGKAVAGRIGTQDQVKVTVFGPVVNLASRLENMTKLLNTPILLDEATAEAIRTQVSPDLARCRRLAVVRPYGLDAALEVSELLPPATGEGDLAPEHIAAYEAALDALLDRRWGEAIELLHLVPARDRVKDFLTGFILQHNRTPPADWDGVIPLSRKG